MTDLPMSTAFGEKSPHLLALTSHIDFELRAVFARDKQVWNNKIAGRVIVYREPRNILVISRFCFLVALVAPIVSDALGSVVVTSTFDPAII
jgi:hypothetical protein